MAVSAWGRVLADTVDRIRAITPTLAPQVRWDHVGPEKDERLIGATDREYTTRDLEVSGGDDAVAGAGYRQQRWTVSLRIAYRGADDVEDMIAADHADLVSALQPTSTYPSGTWGSLRVRRVMDLTREEDDETGLLYVEQEIEHIIRYPVSI